MARTSVGDPALQEPRLRDLGRHGKLLQRLPIGRFSCPDPATYRDLREGAKAFDGQVLLYRSMGSTPTGVERPVRVSSLVVTARMFRVLRTKPAVGFCRCIGSTGVFVG